MSQSTFDHLIDKEANEVACLRIKNLFDDLRDFAHHDHGDYFKLEAWSEDNIEILKGFLDVDLGEIVYGVNEDGVEVYLVGSPLPNDPWVFRRNGTVEKPVSAVEYQDGDLAYDDYYGLLNETVDVPLNHCPTPGEDEMEDEKWDGLDDDEDEEKDLDDE